MSSFFREHSLEKVYPSAAGAHQIVTTQCEGVHRGSGRSLCVVEGVLYYHGVGGVYAYDGSLPRNVSREWGETRYADACADTVDGRYYISLRDSAGSWHLFCMDTRRKLWHREDSLHAMAFAPGDGELFCLDAGSGQVLTLLGTQGTREVNVPFLAETGELGLTEMENKYLQRVELSLLLGAGASLSVDVSYDSGVSWEQKGTVSGTSLRAVVLPIRPRRCHHLRLRLRGTGECQLYALCGIYEKGSDTP